MALTKVSTDGVKDDAVTTDKLANAINTERTANTAKVQTTINNNADNRVITGSGTANTLNAESSVVIDSSGDIGLGTSSPNATGYTSPITSLGVTNNGYSVLELQGLQSSNGAVGVITGYNTSGNSRIATINWNRSGGNNYGSISFETANNGSLGERARITNNGLTFNGDTAAANALEDYEEGTWTPTSNVGAITTYSAHYVKVGKAVTVQAYIEFPSMSGSSGANFGSFPFSSGTGDDRYSCLVASNTNFGGYQLAGVLSGTTLEIKSPSYNSNDVSLNALSGKIIVFSIAYTVV